MQQAFLVARQVFLIFIYMGVGIVCTRRGILDEQTGRKLSGFALSVIMPLLLIRYYLRPLVREELWGLGLAFFLALVFHALATVAAVLLIPKAQDTDKRIERLGVVISNCGYMAIPLIKAVLGDVGVFYALAYISVFNLVLWSVGIVLLTGERKMSAKKLLLNPGVLGFAAGALLYFLQVPIPPIVMEAIDGLVAMNTPLPMITTGIFLAHINLRETLTNKRIYYVTLLRLVAVPLVFLLMVKLANVSAWMPSAPAVVLAAGLGCACPCAAAVTLMPANFGLKGDYGAQLIAMSTLLSIITLPLMTLVINAWM